MIVIERKILTAILQGTHLLIYNLKQVTNNTPTSFEPIISSQTNSTDLLTQLNLQTYGCEPDSQVPSLHEDLPTTQTYSLNPDSQVPSLHEVLPTTQTKPDSQVPSLHEVLLTTQTCIFEPNSQVPEMHEVLPPTQTYDFEPDSQVPNMHEVLLRFGINVNSLNVVPLSKYRWKTFDSNGTESSDHSISQRIKSMVRQARNTNIHSGSQVLNE